MARPLPVSAVSLISDVLGAMVAALDRIGNERGLSDAEIRQLDALDGLLKEARAARPLAFELFVIGSAAPLREALRRAQEATQLGVPIVELLGMQSAVPRDWRHRRPISVEGLLWLGTTRLVDDLSLICAVGVSSAERQEQLEASRVLQAALGSLAELALHQTAPPDQKVDRAAARVKAAFASASNAIGGEVVAIRAEAAALRGRRQ
jgi:hypothetical protein